MVEATGWIRAAIGALGEVLHRPDGRAAGAERHHAEVSLQAGFAQAVAAAPGVICTIRRAADGTISFPYAGPGTAALLGVEPAALAADGAALLALVHPEDARGARASLDSAAAGELPWRHEFRLLHPSAGTRWIGVNSLPARGPDGGLLWHAFLDDVTERRRDSSAREQAEQELGRSRERFRRLVEAAPEIVLGVASDGRIEFAGPQVASLGYEPAELVGQAVDVLVPERLRAVYADHRTGFGFAPTVRSVGARLELHVRRKDGSEMAVEVSHGPAPDGSTTVVITDLTQRRELERYLRQAQKLEAVGQLAGGVAHDFNNLLTVITGYGAMARQEIGDGPAAGDLDEVLRAAERAARLTGQLLAFSRQQVLRPVQLDLGAVARELMPMLNRLIAEDIRVVLLADDDVPSIVADRGQIEQVIVNLAVNARDAMPAGGVLTVEVQERSVGEEDGTQRRSGLSAGGYACLTVSDTGGGIDPDTAAHAFEPFFTTKEAGRGTGLGLATVHGIATQAGGGVEIHSQPGFGAAFKVSFPAVGGVAPARPEPDAAIAPRARGDETILVCEDEPAVQKLVGRLLRRHGYSVLAASGPQEALRVAGERARGSIDLVVSDVVMPGMPGPELAERLLTLHGPVRTLFMSGHPAETVRNRGRLPAGSAFLEKPFSAAELVREVRRLLDATDERPRADAIRAPAAVPRPGP